MCRFSWILSPEKRDYKHSYLLIHFATIAYSITVKQEPTNIAQYTNVRQLHDTADKEVCVSINAAKKAVKFLAQKLGVGH